MPSIDVAPDPPTDECPQREAEKLPRNPKTLTGCLNSGPENGSDNIIDVPPVDMTYHDI